MFASAFASLPACLRLLPLLLLAACAGGGEWPSLSDPVPEASDRAAVILRARAVEPQRSGAETDTFATRQEAEAALAAQFARIQNAREHYREAAAALAQASGPNDGDTAVHWGGAQIALTRYSAALSALDPILASTHLGETERVRAEAFFANTERRIAGERQRLAGLKPDLTQG